MATKAWNRILINSLAATVASISATIYRLNKDLCLCDDCSCPCSCPCPYKVPRTGIQWINNWDGKEPRLKPTESGDYSHSGPTAKRNLFFIRHGHYTYEGAQGLTSKGIYQAEYTGKRLRELGFNFDILIRSSMRRAKETSNIIKHHIPEVDHVTTDELVEGAPIKPEPVPAVYRECPGSTDSERIENAFQSFFYRADPWQDADSYELFVCHANVIRYFVCRAMQFPPEAWLRFSLHNCSITWFVIHPDGRVEMKAFGDSGHIPTELLTA